MKLPILFLFFLNLCFLLPLKAQNAPDTTVLRPEYPEGEEALHTFIRRTANPFLLKKVMDQDNGLRRQQVSCRFIVGADGALSDITVTKSVHPELDKEMQRIIAQMPRWEPAMLFDKKKNKGDAGIPVEMRYTLSIPFESHYECDTLFAYRTVEYEPEYRGGSDELEKYIRAELEHYKSDYPEIALTTPGIPRRVICSFIVDAKGEIHDLKVIQSVSPALDRLVLMILAEMPRWIPARHKGNPVCTYYYVPVAF